jgi:hypothetical protein
MTVRRYSAIDVDSPLLLPETGSLNNVLKTCLNEGYVGRPAAGWAIPYSDGYEKVVYQGGAGSRSRCFRVYDDNTSAPNLASIYGFETMTDVDNGTGKFPSDSQVVAPAYSSILKNTSETVAARNWLIFADSRLCFLIINPEANTTFVNADMIVFGDFVSFNNSDEYNTLLIGRINQTTTLSYNGNVRLTNTIGNTVNGHHAPRSYTQIGNSIRLGKHGDDSNAGVQFPNPVDGGLIMSRYWITEPDVLRGYIPGLWYLASPYTNFTHGDTFSGTGALAGKTFEIVRVYGAALAIETSDTWYDA